MINCKRCHVGLVDEKRLWKKFCDNKCKAEFEEKGSKEEVKKP